MSNYYCPRCGKAIIDNGRYRRDEVHTCIPPEPLYPN